MNPFSVVQDALGTLAILEKSRTSLLRRVAAFKEKKLSSAEGATLLEDRLAHPVEAKPLSGKVAGIDSGFLAKSLYSVDLMMVRSVGVVFHLAESQLEKSEYYPTFFSFPKPYLSTMALQKEDIGCSKSLHRLKEEMGTAREVIEKYSPDYCFLDGSLLPQHADKPRKDSNIQPFYQEVLEEFRKLYALSEKKNCELVACVKDSRGTRLKSILEKCLAKEVPELKQNETLYDSYLVDFLLNPNERSFVFPYAESIPEHPVLGDLNSGWAEKIHVFYLKCSRYDLPVRVEFLGTAGEAPAKAARLASVVHALSSSHREFAFPSILLEADIHARLKPEEVSAIHDKILDSLGASFKFRLRRNAKPL